QRSVPVDSLLVGREFVDRAVGYFVSDSPDGEDLFRLLLIRFMEPTHVLDPMATELDKDAARRSVPTDKESVLAGQVIVREGDLIGETEVERLNAYTAQLQTDGLLEPGGLELATLAGAGLLHLLILAVFGLLLYFFRPEVYVNFRWLVLLALLAATYFGAAAVVDTQQWPPELLPIAFVTLSVAVLWDGRMALVLALTLSALTGALQPFSDYRLVALTLLGGAAAALAVRVIRRRAQTWIFVAVVGAAYTAGTLAFFLMQGLEPVDTAVDLAWLLGNGTVSAILAMGFIPVFEWFTGITTDQTLLEWADPNRPLLRRLALEAPGTYAHTINVANLAEAGAGAIDANGLLCRVGIYYHDVGKMLKPQYFVENQPGGRNPHDKLKPDTSASIVREHITEGYRLAKEAGVPDVIADFVLEHHGTQKIGFFWEKAKEEHDEEDLDPEQFQYPGPRPRSKETAIAMLADSVESATRALQDPTPERTRDLVHNIVKGKIEAGQLDEAPLTLKEIAALEEQFTKILSGMYHHRIDYPSTRHLTESGPGGGTVIGDGERSEPPQVEAVAADRSRPDDESGSAGEGRDAGRAGRVSEKGS
ncbi:MAG: HD family phosphohydrolase, partial [Gemmatimonadota bacterium]